MESLYARVNKRGRPFPQGPPPSGQRTLEAAEGGVEEEDMYAYCDKAGGEHYILFHGYYSET